MSVGSGEERVRVRFAPSPTGHLHVGGARTALFNWLFARHSGGVFILRIEDTDLARNTPESERKVLEDLRWLGLEWDEGPEVGGPFGPYRQSERLDIYRRTAEGFIAGGRAFRCYCTDEELRERRAQAQAAGRPPHYDGRCRDLTERERRAFEAEGRSAAVRFRAEGQVVVDDAVRGRVAFGEGMVGDFVILRSDGWPTYNFAAVCDDDLMQVSHVIRGEEHLPNTVRQVMLYRGLERPTPVFAHLSLILGKDRSKLSKRHGAASVGRYREVGYLPEAVVNYLALLGWSSPAGEEIMATDRLVEAFSLDRVAKAPAIFDESKLNWVSKHYIQRADLDRLVGLARPRLTSAEIAQDEDRVRRAVDLVRGGLENLSEIGPAVGFLLAEEIDYAEEAKSLLETPRAREVLAAFGRGVRGWDAATEEAFKTTAEAVSKETGARGKDLYLPLRAALTGRLSGPELVRVVALHGKEKVDRFVQRALEVF